MESFLLTVRRVNVPLMIMAFAGVPLLSGCSSQQQLKTAPVKGVVLFRGKPLAGARVTFFAPKAPLPSMGETNENGEFELTTLKKGDGAIVGENKVTVISVAIKAETVMGPPDPTKMLSGDAKPGTTAKVPKADKGGVQVPGLYGDLEHTPLTWTVKPEGSTDVKLELK